jgi:uncharacterized protein HemX
MANMAKPLAIPCWDWSNEKVTMQESGAVIQFGAFMSESRSNQTSQAGMAILAIVVLIGALFLGVGGVVWFRVRAQRAAVEEAMMMEAQARYEAEAQRQRADAAQSALDAAKERAEEPVPAETP